MKKALLFLALLVAVALFAMSCGGTTTTTGPGASTTASSTVTSGGASSTTVSSTTTSGTPSSEATTSSSVAAQPGQLMIELTGANMVPPVQTTNTATLTFSLQGTSIMYQLTAQGLQPSDVTAAGIYINPSTGAATTTSAGGGTASQQGTLVIDLLAGQSGSSTTSAGGATGTTAVGTGTTAAGTTGTTASGAGGTVIASGTLGEQNLVGDWAGRSVADIVMLFSQLTTPNSIWAQVNTQQNPNGELRGYVDVNMLIQQLLGSVGAGPGTGTSGTTTTGGGTTSSS